MRNRLVCVALALALTSVLAFVPSMPALGDAGGFSGTTDYSYDSGHSGGSSSDDSIWGDLFFLGLIFRPSGEGDLGDPIGWVVTIGIIAVLILGSMRKDKHKKGSNPHDVSIHMRDEFDASKLKGLNKLTDAEASGFNADTMEEHIASLFIRLQDAWQAKDLEPVRPLLSDKLYAQLDRQLDALRKGRRTNKIEDATVMDVQLNGWYEESGNISVVAVVKARLKDWTIDDKTGDVVAGNPKAEKFMTYRYILTQPKGSAPADQTVTNCPNCGAPIDVNKSAECPYCGTMIKSASFTWVVTSIQALEQRTA